MARVANRARRDMSHEVGEQVWLATKNLPLKVGTRKLAAIYTGPFEILEIIGPVAYRLRLPDDWNIHDVFHVSQLKSVVGHIDREHELQVESGTEYEVERVVDVRTVRGQRQFLVKWKSYPDFDNMWIAESEMGNAQEAIEEFYASLSRKTKPRRGSGVRDQDQL